MSVVYKYPFRTTEPITVPLRAGEPVVHVGVDPSGDPLLPCIWVEHADRDTTVRTSSARFAFFGTGQPIPDHAIHVGSCVAESLVWHVYLVD